MRNPSLKLVLKYLTVANRYVAEARIDVAIIACLFLSVPIVRIGSTYNMVDVLAIPRSQ